MTNEIEPLDGFHRNERNYWIAQRAYFDTYLHMAPRFRQNETARTHLLHSRGATHEADAQSNYDAGLVDRVQGCWEQHLLEAGLEKFMAGVNPGNIAANDIRQQAHWYIRQAHEGSKFAFNFFGADISLGQEARIRDMLVAGIDTRFFKNDSRFAALFEEFDNITIEILFGSAMVSIGNEAPRTRRAGMPPLTYEAEDTLLIDWGVSPFNFPDDVTPSRQLLRLGIPAGFKRKITMLGDGADSDAPRVREVVNKAAKNDYVLTGAKFNEFLAKLTGTITLEAAG